jgi:hypothetical protein
MKKLLLSTLLALSTIAPAAAQPYSARVCTRHADGFVNVRAVIGLYGRIIGRAYNGQSIALSGWHGDQDGFRWLQTANGGWIRGDYLCQY